MARVLGPWLLAHGLNKSGSVFNNPYDRPLGVHGEVEPRRQSWRPIKDEILIMVATFYIILQMQRVPCATFLCWSDVVGSDGTLCTAGSEHMFGLVSTLTGRLLARGPNTPPSRCAHMC